MSIFSRVKAFHPRRNTFDLTHERKFTCPMGAMVPIYVEEVVPGDRFKVATELMLRMAPMINPVMHRVNVYTHFFYVPSRLLWDEWQDFITGGERPDPDGELFEGNVPSFCLSGMTNAPMTNFSTAEKTALFSRGTLSDYMGIMGHFADFSNHEVQVPYSILPFRAYQMIYNEYYRDEIMQPPVKIEKGQVNGIDELKDMLTMRRRNWEKDYFTTATPWSQKGKPVNVISTVTGSTATSPGGDVTVKQQGTGGVRAWNGQYIDNVLTGQAGTGNMTFGDSSRTGAFYDPRGTLQTGPHSHDLGLNADGTPRATGTVSVNDIRAAFQVQRWLERNMRAGSRYVESILAHFGVRSSDARLQRPEFLGGGKSPITISEVLQTANTFSSQSGTSAPSRPTGDMAGHGFSAAGNHAFKRFFEEHGFIIGIMTVMPRAAYNHVQRRFWVHGTRARTTAPGTTYTGSRFDFYWPEFAHLGEQQLYNFEVLNLPGASTSTDMHNMETFGYMPRYNEYRYCPSTVHGMFATTMRQWHMARVPSEEQSPESDWRALNGDFIECRPTSRIFAVMNGPDADQHCWVQLLNRIKAVRPMPKFGAGGLIDH